MRLSKPPPVPSEHDEQCAIIKWWGLVNLNYPDAVLWANPSGGWRHPATAARLKKEGVVPGVPDLFCCDRGKAPLWIELKRVKGGRVSDVQKVMIERLKKFEHRVEICRGHKEAIDVIMGYLKGE